MYLIDRNGVVSIWGICSREMKDIIFAWSTWGEIEPMWSENDTKIRKQEKLPPFWMAAISEKCVIMGKFEVWAIFGDSKRCLTGENGVASQLLWDLFHAWWKMLFLCAGEHVRWDWTNSRRDWNEHWDKHPSWGCGWSGQIGTATRLGVGEWGSDWGLGRTDQMGAGTRLGGQKSCPGSTLSGMGYQTWMEYQAEMGYQIVDRIPASLWDARSWMGYQIGWATR